MLFSNCYEVTKRNHTGRSMKKPKSIKAQSIQIKVKYDFYDVVAQKEQVLNLIITKQSSNQAIA